MFTCSLQNSHDDWINPMNDTTQVILAAILALLAFGAFNALNAIAHHRNAQGDHLLSIIRWRDESDAADDD